MTAIELPPVVPVLDEPPVDEHAALVAYYTQRKRAQDEADRIVRLERAGAVPEPSLVPLGDFLAVEDAPVRYRIEGAWPVKGRVVLAAQYKAGKTTLVGNLVRCLADGGAFLDEFPVAIPEGRVVLIDNEMSEDMIRRWLREQQIVRPDRVAVLSLKGKVSAFDLLDPECLSRWADNLREHQAAIVIFDCLRPVLDALGLSEDKDAGRFLVAFDALVDRSGADEALVVHHMGHAGERSRGDTRIRDWPDVEWTLVRDKGEDGENDPSGPRFFKAYGRDVDQAEGLLEYNPGGRRLSWAGGNRRDAAADQVVPQVLDYLASNPGRSQNAVETALAPTPKNHVRGALRRAVERGLIRVEEGPRRSRLHYLATPENPTAPTAPALRQRTPDDCATAPIEGAVQSVTPTTTAPAAQSSAGQDLGPCTRCHTTTVRYGVTGHALCPRCQQEATR